MQNTQPTISIVTPTYNRGELLKNCFESLRQQTCCDFEWIIVDDGSTDHTEQIANGFLNSPHSFPIEYVQKPNGGKHTALNSAHAYIRGQYVLILDSDDTLLPEAVEIAIAGWKAYEKNSTIGFVTFLKQQTSGEINAYGKEEGVPLDVLHHKRICVASSDCCEVIRADLFKQFPFPVFPGERFLAETALWYRVGIDYKCVYINKPIYVCEYMQGGLTKEGRAMRIRNSLGGMYTSYLRMNRRCTIAERLKAGLLYICYGKFAGKSGRAIQKEAKPYGGLIALLYPFGWIMWRVWRRKYG